MSMGGFAANIINVSFQGNGGEFTVGPEGFQSGGFGVDIEAGKTMADSEYWMNDGYSYGDLNTKKFNPNADVSREQLVLMMYRYLQNVGYDTSASSDLSGLKNAENTSDWALNAVKFIQNFRELIQ